MFNGRKLLIATKHNKEQVIAPVFESTLGVKCFVTNKFDTDTLGTFSGEIERKEDALSTLRNKCLLAMEANNCDLAIASEGSFGIHPTIFIAHADDEMMLFIDKKNELEIVVREISTKTNFNATEVKTEEELLEFSEKVQFPSHGLILKSSKEKFIKIYKGITDKKQLLENFNSMLEEFGSVYVETDMRANFNPTRMKVIKEVALKLLKSIQNECSVCKFPGFSVTKVNRGLPCEWCKRPTQSTLSFTYQCKKCNYEKVVFYPHKKKQEEPMYCDYCNP